MSVVIETTQGDVTVDLFLKERPKTCLNFLKLCKTKAYNLNLFHLATLEYKQTMTYTVQCRIKEIQLLDPSFHRTSRSQPRVVRFQSVVPCFVVYVPLFFGIASSRTR